MKRWLYYSGLALMGFCVLGIVLEGLALKRLKTYNQTMQTLLSGHDVPLYQRHNAPPEVQLAWVIYLHGKHRYDDALAEIDRIPAQDSSTFQAQVRYNLGNLYLDQAIEHTEAFHIDQALPLAQLAKDAYRAALRLNSDHWSAKYNLEVAMRLLPEMGRLQATDSEEGEQPEQLWTTVPGLPRGLP